MCYIKTETEMKKYCRLKMKWKNVSQVKRKIIFNTEKNTETEERFKTDKTRRGKNLKIEIDMKTENKA
jgi:hypothetical protein